MDSVNSELRDLVVAGNGSEAAIQALNRRAIELRGSLQRADDITRNFQRNIGNYPTVVNSARTAFLGFIQAVGFVGGIQAFTQAFGNAFDIVRDFELQSATLASVLGTTREGIVALDEDALRLGATTQFTATEVGNLQEQLARLGTNQANILSSTEGILQLATALQSDLGESAELVGATLNQFQLDADETQRVVDVLARSTQISALNFMQLSTALPIVGTTAAAVGLSLEDVTSQLAVLSSRGVDASTSSTGLRNLFIELSKQGISYEDALSQIANSTDRLGTASQLFGTRGATIGLILSETTDQVDEFNTALLNADGTARVASETLLNTFGRFA